MFSLPALCLWGEFCNLLLVDAADLPGPLGALGVGGVSRGLILTLLLNLSGALDDIVLHIVDLLLCPALGFVLSPADLRSLDITILDKRGPANLSGLVEGNLLILDETVLPEVLLAVLLLLGLVVGDIGGVAPPVVGVVALDNIIVFGLFDHLDLVDTPLPISTGSSNSREANICASLTLTIGSTLKTRKRRGSSNGIFMSMVFSSMMLLPGLLVEGEGVDERPLVPSRLAVPSKSASS